MNLNNKTALFWCISNLQEVFLYTGYTQKPQYTILSISIIIVQSLYILHTIYYIAT